MRIWWVNSFVSSIDANGPTLFATYLSTVSHIQNTGGLTFQLPIDSMDFLQCDLLMQQDDNGQKQFFKIMSFNIQV